MGLGQRLKELRLSKKLNQSDLAGMLNVDRTTYGKYETGDSSPDYDKLLKLANFFEVSTDYLLGKTTIRTPIGTIAASHDDEKWTKEEMEDIEQFKKFVKSQRGQRENK